MTTECGKVSRLGKKNELGAVAAEYALISLLLFFSVLAVSVMGVFMFKQALTKNAANDVLRVAEGKIGLWTDDPKGKDAEEHRKAFEELISDFNNLVANSLHGVKLKSYLHEDGHVAPFAFLPPGECARELGSNQLVCNSHMCGSLSGGFGSPGDPLCQVAMCDEADIDPTGPITIVACSDVSNYVSHGYKLCESYGGQKWFLCEKSYDDTTSYHEKVEEYPVEVRVSFDAISWLKLPGAGTIRRSSIATGFPRLLLTEEVAAFTPPPSPPSCLPWTTVMTACDTNCGQDYWVTNTTRCDYAYCCDPRPEDTQRFCDRPTCCAPWQTVPGVCERACDGGHWVTNTSTCTPNADEECCDGTKPEDTLEWCPGYPDWSVSEWGTCNAACEAQGTQTRTVSCSDVFCCGSAPTNTQICTGQPCPTTCPEWQQSACPPTASCAPGETQTGTNRVDSGPVWRCPAADGRCKPAGGDDSQCGSSAPVGNLQCDVPVCSAAVRCPELNNRVCPPIGSCAPGETQTGVRSVESGPLWQCTSPDGRCKPVGGDDIQCASGVPAGTLQCDVPVCLATAGCPELNNRVCPPIGSCAPGETQTGVRSVDSGPLWQCFAADGRCKPVGGDDIQCASGVPAGTLQCDIPVCEVSTACPELQEKTCPPIASCAPGETQTGVKKVDSGPAWQCAAADGRCKPVGGDDSQCASGVPAGTLQCDIPVCEVSTACPELQEKTCPPIASCAPGETQTGVKKVDSGPAWQCAAADGRCKPVGGDDSQCASGVPAGTLQCDIPVCEVLATCPELQQKECPAIGSCPPGEIQSGVSKVDSGPLWQCSAADGRCKPVGATDDQCGSDVPSEILMCDQPICSVPDCPPWEEHFCPVVNCPPMQVQVGVNEYSITRWTCPAADGLCRQSAQNLARCLEPPPPGCNSTPPSGDLTCSEPICVPSACEGYWFPVGSCSQVPCDKQETVTKTWECLGGDCCEPKPADETLNCQGPPCEQCNYVYQLWEGGGVAFNEVQAGRDEVPQCIADFLTNSRRCELTRHSDISYLLNYDDGSWYYYEGHGVEGWHYYDNCTLEDRRTYRSCVDKCADSCRSIKDWRQRRSCNIDCRYREPDCWFLEANEVADFFKVPHPENLLPQCADHLEYNGSEWDYNICEGATWFFDKDCNAVEDNGFICGVFTESMCPVSLVFSDDGKISGDGSVVKFKLDPTRDAEWSVWKAGEKAPLLVYDPKHQGKIDNAYQIFGNYAFGGRTASLSEARLGKDEKPHSEPWKDGYEAMALLDTNGDGEIAGGELAPLALWFDKNQNAVSERGEVVSLKSKGITALYYRDKKQDAEMIAVEKGYRQDKGGKPKFGKSVDWFGEVYRSQHDAHAALFSNPEAKKLVVPAEKAKVDGDAGKLAQSNFDEEDLGPDLSGFWVWTILETNGEKRPGVFAINDRGDQITGWSVVDIPVKSKKGKTRTARTMLPLQGDKSRDKNGNHVISLNVWNKDRTSLAQSKVIVLKDGEMLRGSTEQQAHGNGGKVISMKYDWVATRIQSK